MYETLFGRKYKYVYFLQIYEGHSCSCWNNIEQPMWLCHFASQPFIEVGDDMWEQYGFRSNESFMKYPLT